MAIRELDGFGRRQYGLVTKEQLIQVKSPGAHIWIVRSGELEIVHDGVYRLPGMPRNNKSEIMAAVLASPKGAVASFESAAFLHGLRVTYSGRPDVTVPPNRSRSRAGINSHFGNLTRAEYQIVQGIPATTLERTVIDLAASASRFELARLIDDVVVEGRSTYARLASALSEAGGRGRRGAKLLRQLLEERVELEPDGVASKIQLKVLKAARLAGLPAPITEFEVRTNGRRYFLDVAWPDQMIAAEADGFSAHGRSKARFHADRERHNHICGAGWRLLHFTNRMSVSEIAAQLRKVWTL